MLLQMTVNQIGKVSVREAMLPPSCVRIKKSTSLLGLVPAVVSSHQWESTNEATKLTQNNARKAAKTSNLRREVESKRRRFKDGVEN